MNKDGQFLWDALLNASRLVECSLFTLCLMFGWTLTHFAEACIRYSTVGLQTRRFLKEREKLLNQGELKSLLALVEGLARSHVATIYSRCLRELETDYKFIPSEQSGDALSRLARIVRNELHEDFRKGLNGLSAISTTAPLIGLLGTTIGVLDSLSRGWVGNKYGYLPWLAGSLAKALIPSAVGLLVGVLATWCFNWQNNRLVLFDGEMEAASLELESYFKTKATELGKRPLHALDRPSRQR